MKFAKKKITLKKTAKAKTYVTGHRNIFTKPIRQLHREIKEGSDLFCSHSIFYKYKPFYIGPTAERKKSCFCIKCQNTHLLLKEINNFGKSENLMLLFLFSNWVIKVK